MPDPVVPPVVPPAPAPLWHAGVDPTLVAHWQLKGYDMTDPVKVATAASKGHIEAEKFIGVPAAELLRMPKPTDEAGTKAFWQRLGVPADVKEYDFTGVKDAEGKPLVSDALADDLRGAFAKAYVPKEAAAQIAKAVVEHNAKITAAANVEMQAKIDTERGELQKNWGKNWDANLFIAKQAAQKLGFTAEAVDALQKIGGYKATMEALHKVGTAIGEDKFVWNNSGPVPGVLTVDQAKAKKAELMRDTAWTDRYMKGGAPEAREMLALNTIIVGDDTDDSRRR